MRDVKKIEKLLVEYMNKFADLVGRPQVFIAVLIVTLIWFLSKTLLEYDVWFDIMDVFVFLASFFLLFIIQSSQNNDTRAIQDKLDAIIAALPKADQKKVNEEAKLKKGDKKP